MPDSPFVLRLAGCLLVDSSDSVLLLHRRVAPVQWELPGGKVEPRESPEIAARRELKEELGVHPLIERRIGDARFEQDGVIYHYIWFMSRLWDGQPQIREPHVFDHMGWFPLAALAQPQLDFSPNLRALGAMSPCPPNPRRTRATD